MSLLREPAFFRHITNDYAIEFSSKFVATELPYNSTEAL